MRNVELTNWLEIVWDALTEEDDAKRNLKLLAAHSLLGEQSVVARIPQTQNGDLVADSES